jgi:transketolase
VNNNFVERSGPQSGALDERSLQLRRLVLRALQATDKGHVGSALSLIEILRVLYDDVIRHDPARPEWPDRDHVILSKGHGCLGLYAILVDKGYIAPGTLDTVCQWQSPLGGHPERQLSLGIEASTGSLGHGLPLAVGIALAHRRREDSVRVYVIVGDGELAEGSNWEALLMAAKYQLSNLTVIVDHNGQQIYGTLDTVLPLAPLRAKLEAFGALTFETDGHSPRLLRETFARTASRAAAGPPSAVICHTIKGRGFAAAERNTMWHYKRGFSESEIRQMAAELGETP